VTVPAGGRSALGRSPRDLYRRSGFGWGAGGGGDALRPAPRNHKRRSNKSIIARLPQSSIFEIGGGVGGPTIFPGPRLCGDRPIARRVDRTVTAPTHYAGHRLRAFLSAAGIDIRLPSSFVPEGPIVQTFVEVPATTTHEAILCEDGVHIGGSPRESTRTDGRREVWRPLKLTIHAAAHIRGLIIDRVCLPGRRSAKVDLARRIGVSRSPLARPCEHRVGRRRYPTTSMWLHCSRASMRTNLAPIFGCARCSSRNCVTIARPPGRVCAQLARSEHRHDRSDLTRELREVLRLNRGSTSDLRLAV